MIKIFKCSDRAEDVFEEAMMSGIVGVAGSRVHTRKLIDKVDDIANNQGVEEIYSISTYNHPEAELAYIFNTDLYSKDEAMKLVIKTYNNLLTQETDLIQS